MYWNMCCAVDWMFQNRLTLTWDVLKFDLANGILYAYAININMRCIEMRLVQWKTLSARRLTLTWDVLK